MGFIEFDQRSLSRVTANWMCFTCQNLVRQDDSSSRSLLSPIRMSNLEAIACCWQLVRQVGTRRIEDCYRPRLCCQKGCLSGAATKSFFGTKFNQHEAHANRISTLCRAYSGSDELQFEHLSILVWTPYYRARARRISDRLRNWFRITSICVSRAVLGDPLCSCYAR